MNGYVPNGPGVSPKQRCVSQALQCEADPALYRRPLRRFVATWDFNTVRADELPLCRVSGVCSSSGTVQVTYTVMQVWPCGGKVIRLMCGVRL